MENVVEFSFTPDTPFEEQKEALEMIRAWPGVGTAAHLRPQSKSASVQRMAFVRLTGDGDLAATLKKIQSLPSVDGASIPATRMLMTAGPK